MAEIPLFSCLNAVNEKIPVYKYSKKDCSAYMLLLWLSHAEGCMPYLDKLNERLFGMPDELVFSALYKGIPRGKRFIKWDKGIKDKEYTKKKEAIIKALEEDHGFSSFEAKTLFKRYIDV
jgi:hypothetical protein